MKSHRHSLLVAGLMACAAFTASAQPAPADPAGVMPPAAGAQAERHGKAMDPQQRMERMKARHAKRMADLKAKLQLTGAQQSAWESYAGAFTPPAMPPGPRPDVAKMTTPERLDRMQARQAEHQARFAKIADATRTFYSQLTPQQRQTFDAETVPRMHARGDHPRGHGPRPDAAPRG
ncbi:Spy/CpxP family protein refolding chaperone [Pseudacidovorax sp. RU35E]|uniref:Spy/CpxP family protein refolding chaperone n=1 Tax=Pseudacidovorax sp. RU35E TaxID=1907403 RepID=UPI000955B76F|nr:Spy/CpxP family protein refolding chaperone [Pseudacidovorax sp. RU35E]SIQ31201.1 LTXXQ motif family protein [Pseudacidovorax sp. RU35E]